jgi:hypothetical protein
MTSVTSTLRRYPRALAPSFLLALAVFAGTQDAGAQCRTIGQGCAQSPLPITCGGATKLGYVTLDTGVQSPAFTIYAIGTQLKTPMPIPGLPSGVTCCPKDSSLFVDPAVITFVKGGLLKLELPIDPALLNVEAAAQGFVAKQANSCLSASDAVAFVIFAGTK